MLLKNKSRFAAFGGIFTALAVLFMYTSSFLPTGKLVLVFLASSVIGVCLNMYGTRLSALVYIASALVSLLVVPEKTYVLLYAVVVGNYPLFKPYLERIGSLAVRIAVKLAVFNIYMLICWALAVFVLKLPLDTVYPFYLLWFVMLLAFFVYDYAYSLFMQKIYYKLPKN